MTPNEKPLVTFALFAYNQEQYIREAIEGAFAQTYSPLQIVLSDDCSNDDTFKIMQEMASKYDGLHEITLNRNSQNGGIGKHVKTVARLCAGEIIVMAAGDDISLGIRVARLVEMFVAEDNLMAAFSNWAEIDDSGKVMRSHKHAWNSITPYNLIDAAYGGGGVGLGATYAYKRDCFFWPEEYPESFMNEDRILPFRAAILGGLKS